ncbi:MULTISPECIES: hypothetical protein [unclassified Janthinobacterium]|uniref:hypothetical protein n=1 Tax=unclassified Janthinobacterium TaxID=2610881 RepID=UPI00160C020C|nr:MULTISPECIES: hypothetical protein [unclassified Janthinobacterium]MBB5610406.1 hypothetical protein [Janthinobacterium sp. S3T4]MBB5615757.1 hypothetical protein [Janthinobacterium sp. S3M3]
MDEQALADVIRNFETKSFEEASQWADLQGNTDNAIAFRQWNTRRQVAAIAAQRAEDLALAVRNTGAAEASSEASQLAADAAVRAAEASERAAVAGERSAAASERSLRLAVISLVIAGAALAISAYPYVVK